MTLSLDALRKRAKNLRKSYEMGETVALQRLKVHPPRERGPLKHADFLHVVACEQGFESWPKLKFAAETQGLDRAQQRQRLKIALFNGQNWMVDRLLAQTPDLAEGMFALQVSLLNADVVETMLAEDPGRATQMYGPARPIVHLAFSKRFQINPAFAPKALAIADMLLAHGADVNDSRPVAPGNAHRLSALYGAIGHADNMPLARWLLEHGATPNDGESLYHATELGHHEGLRLLLAHGADPQGTNALLRAIDFNDHEAVQMLLDAGARADDFNGTHVGGERPWVIPALHQAARRMSDARMIDVLLAAGADPKARFEGCSAYGYARVFGNPVLSAAIEAAGAAPELSAQEGMLASAVDGPLRKGAFVDPALLPDAYRNILHNLVHLPGKLDHIKRLVALGLEYDRPDAEGLPPVQVAGWEGLPEIMGYFLSLNPDLSHVNGYGGTLLGAIIHGAENCPARASRDYIACARLALTEGVALPRQDIGHVGDEALSAFLQDWAETYPGQVV